MPGQRSEIVRCELENDPLDILTRARGGQPGSCWGPRLVRQQEPEEGFGSASGFCFASWQSLPLPLGCVRPSGGGDRPGQVPGQPEVLSPRICKDRGLGVAISGTGVESQQGHFCFLLPSPLPPRAKDAVMGGGRLGQVGWTRDSRAQVCDEAAFPAGQQPSTQAPASRATLAPGERGIVAIYTLPLPWGPRWGQVSRDNRCHHSGKAAPGEALISPHLHSHSNRKQDSHCLIGRGWAPGKASSGLSCDDLAWAARCSSPPPQAAGRSPSWAPVRQPDEWPDRWLDRHTWMSDMQTPSRPAVSSTVTAGCSIEVKVHRAIAKPLGFPEVTGRLSSGRK